MNANHENTEAKNWSPDICAMAKWAALLGGCLYALWIANYFCKFDGIFNRQNLLVGGDFANDWSAARLILVRQIMTLFDLVGYHAAQQALFGHELLQFYNWSYPPSLLPWIIWLGFFPYPVALFLWLAVTFALYAFALAYRRPMSGRLALILALAPSSFINAAHGQNGFLSAALLAGGLRLLSARPVLAGILFGLLTFKPQLGLLVPIALVVARQWQAFAAAALTALASMGFSIALFGIEPWHMYLTVMPQFQRSFLESDTGPDLIGGYMMPSVFRAMRVLGASLFSAYAAAGIAALAAVLSVIYAFARSKAPELRGAVLLTATLLTSPYIFSYDMTILTTGILGTIAALGAGIRPYHLILILIAWFLPAFVFQLNEAHIPLSPLVIGILLAVQLRFIHTQKNTERSL